FWVRLDHRNTWHQPVPDQREEPMSSFEKAKDKAEQLIGEAEKKVGRMLGLEDPENVEKRDLLTGEVKEAGHDLRDDQATGTVDDAGAVDDTGAVDDSKDKLSDDDK
ncbi:MAG: hypothetical protein ACREQV_16420, partial [Candidatus Binatia bacterium]